MTKEQMIALLKVKNAQVAPILDEKAKDEAAQSQPAQESGDMMKELAAKLDLIAQALGQLMEKVDAMGKEEASEQDEESDSEPAKEDEQKQEPAKEDESEPKKGEEEEKAGCEDMNGKDEDEQDMEKDEEEKELSLDEVNSTIATLTAQISALDEEVNG